MLALAATLLVAGDHNGALAYYLEALKLAQTRPVEQSADLYVRWRLADSYARLSHYHAVRAAAAERLNHWREARQYAQQRYGL